MFGQLVFWRHVLCAARVDYELFLRWYFDYLSFSFITFKVLKVIRTFLDLSLDHFQRLMIEWFNSVIISFKRLHNFDLLILIIWTKTLLLYFNTSAHINDSTLPVMLSLTGLYLIFRWELILIGIWFSFMSIWGVTCIDNCLMGFTSLHQNAWSSLLKLL